MNFGSFFGGGGGSSASGTPQEKAARESSGSQIMMTGAYFRMGGNILHSLNKYWASRWEAKTLKMQSRVAKWEARQNKADAADLMRQSADAQLAGWQEAGMRGQRLAQDVGRIYAGAAGAGIDVSSYTVRHVEETDRREAAADIDAINANAAAQGASYARQAGNAMAAYHIGMADAAQLAQNAKMAKRRGRWEMIGGLLSTAGQFITDWSEANKPS